MNAADRAVLDAYNIAGSDDARTKILNRVQAEDDARNTRLWAENALTTAALWYVSVGIAIFPLEERGKRPWRGTHGLKDATLDPAQITEWWTRRPQSNIGVPTGHRFDVIDIDGPPGHRSLIDLEPIPTLARAWTGGGGLHLFVTATGRGNGAAIRPGIDYRGNGGYIVAPPSRHPSGQLYRWTDPPTDLITHLAKETAA